MLVSNATAVEKRNTPVGAVANSMLLVHASLHRKSSFAATHMGLTSHWLWSFQV